MLCFERGFTVDRLMSILNLLGSRVEVKVRVAPRSDPRGARVKRAVFSRGPWNHRLKMSKKFTPALAWHITLGKFFIENDGVPWRNNAAETALRHCAVQRKISGAFSRKGAGDYLRLLAVSETCRFQRKSFLGFLLSKSTNVDEYRYRSRVHPDWATDP